MNQLSLALHGGAGTILRGETTPEREQAYLAGLRAPLLSGWEMLKAGATSLDVVEHVVRMLEDDPLFNAGRGAVFTYDETHEMDAAIMSGVDRSCGAIAGVGGVRNPITLARAVMERSDHVLLAGAGAEAFARAHAIPFETFDYFHYDLRHEQWKRARREDVVQLDHSDKPIANTIDGALDEKKFGTVGAVALDASGDVAAATSTGGMTNKRYGRVGDTPLIGAGTWADNNTCAVSCTGHGEYFIRAVAAYDIAALMEYKGMSLNDAADEVVMRKLKEMGGEGGVIAVDALGNIAMPFNTPGMYRGMVGSEREAVVEIFL